MCKAVVDLEKELEVKAIKSYKKLHEDIIGVISSMLRTAKIEPMHYLIDHDPSFTSLVEELEGLVGILKRLKDVLGIGPDGLNIVVEYIGLARNLAEAIDSGCNDSLMAATAALDEKPYI